MGNENQNLDVQRSGSQKTETLKAAPASTTGAAVMKILWTRKVGHLYQSCVTNGRRTVYGYGTTRSLASAKARSILETPRIL